MLNKEAKPKLTAEQLIIKMKSKGIKFNEISEKSAMDYLRNKNNYMRTAAYRKNYQKYLNGVHAGQYIDLDFSYLKELSTIDMHFRFLVQKMSLDIEHDLKVRLVQDIEKDDTTDGYNIVNNFLLANKNIIHKLESASTSPFTSDLINKYFSVKTELNISGKKENSIIRFDDCPAWVLVELLTFGDFIKFYDYYYSSRYFDRISYSSLNIVRSLRNAAAHNNCILADLSHGTSRAPREIYYEIEKIASIGANIRKKKMSCRPMLEFVTLLCVYKKVVSAEVKSHRIMELYDLFFTRMVKNKSYFEHNELIKTNYNFICNVIKSLFPTV